MGIFKSGIGHDLRLWPMFALLLIVVLTPTACLLWFMQRAIENERLAVRKTLEDAYRRDLSVAQKQLEEFWRDRLVALDEIAYHEPPSAVFAKCVRSGWADSVICDDGRGQVVYPAAPAYPPDQTAPLHPTGPKPSVWNILPTIQAQPPSRMRQLPTKAMIQI